MSAAFIKTGIDLIRTAIQNDNIKQYKEALPLYIKGIQYLITAMKYEKNIKIIKVIKEKIKNFIKRAETLQQILNNCDVSEIAKLKQMLNKYDVTSLHSNLWIKAEKQSLCVVFGFCRNDEKQLYTKHIPAEIIDLFFKYYHIFPYEIINKSSVKWTDIGGLKTAKMLLKEAVILPFKFPQLFTGKRKPWKGIMLYGPKGNGKSHLIKACAAESECIIFQIYFCDLLSKYISCGDKIIKHVYDMARNTTQQSIVLLKQIDLLDNRKALLVEKKMGANWKQTDIRRANWEQTDIRRIKTELLVQMSANWKHNTNTLTIGITDSPWDVDCAVRKRYPKRIYIKLPDKDGRREIFKIYINASKINNKFSDDDYDVLTDKTNGLTCYEIYSIVKNVLDVKMNCMELKIDDFINVIDNVEISVKKESLKRYQKWTDEFGCEG